MPSFLDAIQMQINKAEHHYANAVKAGALEEQARFLNETDELYERYERYVEKLQRRNGDVLVEDDEQDDDFETRYFRKLGIDVTILPNPKASRRG